MVVELLPDSNDRIELLPTSWRSTARVSVIEHEIVQQRLQSLVKPCETWIELGFPPKKIINKDFERGWQAPA